MELEFVITEAFDNDIKRFPAELQGCIKNEINLVSESLLNGRSSFMEKASMPHMFNLKSGLDSSLYVVRIDDKIRMVASVDDDPIFNKVSLTLFRLVNGDDSEKAYKETGEQLYKSLGLLQ